jgi:hypothetical protein
MAKIISIQDKQEIAALVTEHCQHKKLVPPGMQLRVEISLVPTQLVLVEETARVAAEIWNMDARKAFLLFQPGERRIANCLNIWIGEQPTPVWYIFEALERRYIKGVAHKSTDILYEWLATLGIRPGATIPIELCVQPPQPSA